MCSTYAICTIDGTLIVRQLDNVTNRVVFKYPLPRIFRSGPAKRSCRYVRAYGGRYRVGTDGVEVFGLGWGISFGCGKIA